jgi:hypothetical protein
MLSIIETVAMSIATQAGCYIPQVKFILIGLATPIIPDIS